MLLESIEALNFRNLEGRIEFGPALNILSGENGQGKTNWLEAIAVLASARSFRKAKVQGALMFGEKAGMVRGTVRESAEIVRELQVTIAANTKSVLVNG